MRIGGLPKSLAAHTVLLVTRATTTIRVQASRNRTMKSGCIAHPTKATFGTQRGLSITAKRVFECSVD